MVFKMGLFDRFRKKESQHSPREDTAGQEDQDSGDELLPRYPGSIMLKYDKIKPRSWEKTGGVYIEYKTSEFVGPVAMWYKDLMTKEGWTIKSWTPPYVLRTGPKGNEHFITIVYNKDRQSCDIGVKWYPTYTKYWIDLRLG
jgi:hypothetical protein